MRYPSIRGHQALPQHLAPTALALTLTLALAACGGGSDGSTPDAVPEVVPTLQTLTGTAATGAALAAAPVEAKCSGGSGSATTGADGVFTVSNLPSGTALPCVLKVTGPGGALFSVATGSGASAVANLTPVTTLAVAHLTGDNTASYYAGFDASAAAALTTTQVQASVAAVKAVLAASGVDLGSTDVLAGPLVAASVSTAGNAYDQALDALNAKLAAAGTTLAEVATSLAAANPAPIGGSRPTLSNVASLPADLLLKPRASNCAALRSGSYRSIDLEDATTQDYPQGGGYPTLTTVIDAATLKVTDDVGHETLTLVPAGDCRYTIDDGVGTGPDAEVIVTGAGVILVRYLSDNVNGIWRASVLVPVQSHTLAELAGDWNTLGFDRSSDDQPHVLRTDTATLSATGAISGLTSCSGLATGCASETTTTQVTADGSGGFHLQGDGWRDRLWAYRAGGGELMLIGQNANGVVSFFTRKQARVLPAVGDVSEGWQFNVVPSGTSTVSFTAPVAVNPFKSTTVAVDAAQQRYTRRSVVNFTTGVTRDEVLVINSPRDGFVHRPAATNVPRSDGALSTVLEWVSLPMRGMGFSPVGLVDGNQLVLAASAAQ